MLAIPGELADVVDMIHNIRERDGWIITRAAHPAWTQHPVIKRDTDHPVSGNDGPYLLVIKLALMRNQNSAIVVTGENWSTVAIQGLPKGFIGEMCKVEKNTMLFHLPKQLDALGCEPKLRGCTTCISTKAIMRRTDD